MMTDAATTAQSSSFSRPQTSPRIFGPKPNGPSVQRQLARAQQVETGEATSRLDLVPWKM